MVSYIYLTSAVVMGLLAVTVFVATARGRRWYDYTPEISPPRPSGVGRVTSEPQAWVAGFVLLVLGATGALVVSLDSGNLTPIFVILGVLFLGFGLYGVYTAARSRGHPHSHAVADAIIASSTLALVVITAMLLTEFGA